MSEIELIATAAFGLESVVARELRQLGYTEQRVSDGRVTFTADHAAICRSNLWLRSADRVLLKMAEFDATDFGELFDRTTELPWYRLMPVDAEFPVRAKSVRSKLHSTPHCQSIVKKGVVESLKHRFNRSRFEESGPKYAIECSIVRDRVTLAVDTSGDGLHRRGYRTWNAAAPLRETLAAGLVQLSFWERTRPFVDPFCGSGTLVLEAALIGRNIAPGLNRSFVAEQWEVPDGSMWSEARIEARDLIQPPCPAPLIGTDIDVNVLKLARRHASQAGLDDDVHFQQRDARQMTSSRKYGCILCNPPWGERLAERSEVEVLYRDLRDVFTGLETWSFSVLTSHRGFEKLIARNADRRRKLYNGRIECTWYQFHGPRPPRKESTLN